VPSRVRPVERENLGQKAYWELREALLEGRFLPGDRIRLRNLAEEMGISVTPVREAVLQLVNEGALQLKSPRDIRVRELDPSEYMELVEIRKFFEGQALEHFLKKMQPHHLAELDRIEQRHQAALRRGDYRSAVSLDRRFMFTIFDAIDMPLSREMLDRLWLLARPTVTLLYSEEGASMVDLGNGQLLTALSAGDPEAAKSVRSEMIDACAAIIVDILDSDQREEAASGGS
jgi:DNA-binding GntR family transcriptional regulator